VLGSRVGKGNWHGVGGQGKAQESEEGTWHGLGANACLGPKERGLVERASVYTSVRTCSGDTSELAGQPQHTHKSNG